MMSTDALEPNAFEPPLDEIEVQIGTIFRAVLACERVGRHDNFFELGGDSLAAVDVIERLHERGLNVDVRDLYTARDVAALAAALKGASDTIEIPPNRIVRGATTIAPEMVPLLELDEREIASIVAGIPGGAANIEDIYPLAPLQEGILFQHAMSDAGDASLKSVLVSFDRRSRLDAFLSALREVIARHAVLRTAIVWQRLTQPVQVVLRNVELPVEEVALGRSGDVAAQLRDRYHPARFRIDVGTAPILRAYIARDDANDRWLVLLVTHQLVVDQNSLDLILHEISLITADRRDLLSKPAAFRDFVVRARLGVPPDEHQPFFRAMLGDVEEPSAPYGLLQPSPERSGGESTHVLDIARAAPIRAAARRMGVAPATIFHLAWALVVGHVSNRRDVVFGTRLLGRMNAGGSPGRTLGTFVNTLPLRIKIDSQGVGAAVIRTHALLADLLRHEHASLALAQRCSGIPPAVPLFAALFDFRHDTSAAPSGAPVAALGLELPFGSEAAAFPVALAVEDRGCDFALIGRADAPGDSDRLCALMDEALKNLVFALEQAPQTPLDTIGVLPDAVYEQVTTGWNATRAVFPTGTIHALVAERTAHSPDEIAVTGRSETLTYAQLAQRADALADVLAAMGAGVGTVVGVVLPRSVETVISLLAILKAGATYLPMELAYPPDRLAYMIADSGATIVISQNATQLQLGPIKRVDLDALEPAPARAQTSVTPDDIAYIIYTSGSTGKPKGVAVPHRAGVNLAFARLAHDPIGPGDRILAAISVGFDVSIGQLVLPLLSGATIVIADDLRTLGAREYWEFLAQERITQINSVPSFFETVIDSAPASTTLQRLILGGEPLKPALVRRLQRALPATQIFNVYGPTETCIDATIYLTHSDETSAVLPIGKPLPNYRAYILDAQFEPVDIGVPGELYLAGAGLAHGYVNAPALTAQRFIPDPFGAPGERLYKTGDRARRRTDGNIEFLGRVDSQIKIRGHRIELGEIEAELARCAGVQEAAAVVREDASGQQRIIAFYSAAAPLAAAELRDTLGAVLPSYMVPSAFTYLRSLPVTTNGKMDRETLKKTAASPEFEPVDAAPSPSAVPELDELQQQLVELWQTLLGVQAVGIHDDFFALGGNSLLAIQLAAQIEKQFQVRLPLSALFERPTIEHFANTLRRHPANFDNSPLVKLNAAGTSPPLFFLHGIIEPAGGYYCLSLANEMGADRPLYVMRPQGLDGGPIPATIEAAATDSIAVLKSVIPEGPYLLGGFSAGGLVAIEMAQQLAARGEHVNNVLLIDTPHFGQELNQTVQFVERFGQRLRLKPDRITQLCRIISQGADVVSRFRAAQNKGQFLRIGLTRNRHNRPNEPDIRQWFAIARAYVPRHYAGRVTVFVSEDDPSSAVTTRGWLSVAPNINIRSISGDHYSCISQHINETAKAFAAEIS